MEGPAPPGGGLNLNAGKISPVTPAEAGVQTASQHSQEPNRFLDAGLRRHDGSTNPLYS